MGKAPSPSKKGSGHFGSLGQPGDGKSALLANWAEERRRSIKGDRELIYEHYCVGKGEHTTGPASKRKRTEDGGDSLSWLPTTFPAGVRIIVSTTQTGAKGQSHLDHSFMVTEPLDEISCAAILKMYERKFSCELDSEEKQLIVAARGSSNPLYVRLLLNGLELFDPNESEQRRQWLEQACEGNQLNAVYELLMKQWNSILLKALLAELEERTVILEAATSSSSHVGASSSTVFREPHNQLRLLARYGFLRDDQLRNCYYRELAVHFEGMEACQRRVDELPVQLERCSMWGVLQNALVNMKMFQLWWSERNRQEFFFYWMEFLSSLGSFSTAGLSESEAERVHKEIDALVIHQDDGYYVRRWLWTQFPLIGTAFESRVFRNAASGRNPVNDEAVGTESNSPGKLSSPSSIRKGAAKKSHHNPAGVVLPKGIGNPRKPLVPTKRRHPHKVVPPPVSESVADNEMGALEFLSAENSEGSLGSVSKLESQLMELRMKYDRMKFVAREKGEALRAVESRVQDSKAEITAAGQSASHIDELLENIRNVNDEAALGRLRSDYYKLILRHCELNPARDPKTIETAEATVAKLKREIVDLQQKAQVVSYEKRLASLDVPKLVQVTQDKTSIHQEALSRLRWRQELDRRLYYANANFVRAKNKLIHMKETSLARQKNTENLQLYVGSAYKDDGILGALRQVGINKPEEALLCWQNQLDHSVQLEEEEKQAEQRVLEYREKLALLQTQFVNLKLSGSSSGKVDGSLEDDAATANGDDDAAASKTSVNAKMLEKQLNEANAVKQKKKDRATRLRVLHEKLQLGLLHIAQLLGVASVQQLNALELVDAIEKVVRVILGDEAHLQAAPSPSFRHRNSTRMVSLTGQTGDSTGLPSDTRSDDDKVRYNIRVSRTEKRQMNPCL
uniref:Uncharacterized protein n=1 Tax=Phytophthora ramorum TaxID=164328 RepID=H3HDI0_PHYRM